MLRWLLQALFYDDIGVKYVSDKCHSSAKQVANTCQLTSDVKSQHTSRHEDCIIIPRNLWRKMSNHCHEVNTIRNPLVNTNVYCNVNTTWCCLVSTTRYCNVNTTGCFNVNTTGPFNVNTMGHCHVNTTGYCHVDSTEYHNVNTTEYCYVNITGYNF